MSQYIFSLVISNFGIWVYSILSPRTLFWVEKFFGIKLEPSIFWPPLFFLPIMFVVNIFYAKAFEVGPKIGISPLATGIFMVVSNVAIFALGALFIDKKIPFGDLALLGGILLGIIAKYVLEK